MGHALIENRHREAELEAHVRQPSHFHLGEACGLGPFTSAGTYSHSTTQCWHGRIVECRLAPGDCGWGREFGNVRFAATTHGECRWTLTREWRQITPRQAREELESHECGKELHILANAIMAVGLPSIGPDGWEMPETDSQWSRRRPRGLGVAWILRRHGKGGRQVEQR